MRKIYLLCMLQTCFAVSLSAQCPIVAGIMVDACGTENQNEFVFVLNGATPLSVDALGLTFPANASITSANNNDFSLPAGTSVPPIGSCITVVTNGASIPANAPVVIFMSNNVLQQYDFTSWCTQYGQLYIMYKNQASPTTPTFLNDNATAVTRSVSLSVSGSPACAATFTYNVTTPAGTSVDGNFFRFPEPTAGVSTSPGFVNNGCASPPPVLLPVLLTSFTAGLINNAVVLNWTTATENNSSHFEIEKSTDGELFSVIGTIAAAGNSDNPLAYRFTDPATVSGKTYYRLRTVDKDGSSKHSAIISIKPSASGIALQSLFPNPVADELIVEWNARQKSNAQLTVVDLYGRIMQTMLLSSVPGYNQGRLRISQLAGGQYFLKLNVDGEQFAEKFVKR